MKRKKRSYKKVCIICGKKKQSARVCINPYIEVMERKIVKQVLCSGCFHDENMSI